MSGKFEGYSRIPLDYPIDALALEASRRSRILGRPYSYGQLIADTTPEEREKIAEEYRERLAAVIRQGGRRVSGGTRYIRPQTEKEVVRQTKRKAGKLSGE